MSKSYKNRKKKLAGRCFWFPVFSAKKNTYQLKFAVRKIYGEHHLNKPTNCMLLRTINNMQVIELNVTETFQMRFFNS